MQHRDPKKEGVAEWMNNSTVERKENVCRERRLLFGDQKSFPRTGFQAF